jgi:hypothetical protein
MKANRKLGFILAGIIIIVLVGVGVLYVLNNKALDRQDELNGTIASNQAILARATTGKQAKEAEAAVLQQQFDTAKQQLTQVGFRDSAESIEYDGILFSIARDTHLQVTSLIASAPVDLKEGSTTYQVTTFSISVEGITPTTIFATGQDSANYIAGVANSILAFVDTVANSPDFDTATIQSVNISAPEPMTNDEVTQLITDIKDEIESKLTDAEILNKTEAEVTALVQSKFAALSALDIQQFLEEAGLDKPTGTITIKIWTYKGV